MIKLKRIGVRLPIHLWEHLRDIAEYKGYTLNSLIVQVLNEFMEEQAEVNGLDRNLGNKLNF